MVVDKSGRAYIGTFEHMPTYELSVEPNVVGAPIIGVSPKGAVNVAAEGLRTPNGIILTPDEQTMIVAETNGHRLTAYTVESDGALANPRTFADLGERRPDGICLDSSGAVWVASVGSNEFLRIADGGEVLDVISVSGRWAVACTLGGEDLRTLYCITAITSREVFLAGRSVGSVETARVEVPGPSI
jgi:sugar lactone lactonase YvrE